MKAYKYKMYSKAKCGLIDNQIDRFGILHNHCVALYRRYYKLFKKNPSKYAVMSHMAKMKHRERWDGIFKGLDAQAVQQLVDRIDKSYRHFFRKIKNHEKASPPKFKKVKKYQSYTLKQCGYKFDGNKVRLNGVWYGFFKSREWKGKVKTVTVKRDRCGDIFIVVITDWNDAERLPQSGKSVGYDFGMKTFLVSSDGKDVSAPLFLMSAKGENKRLSRRISHKVKRSNNRRKAVIGKARFMRRLANRRDDFQWKLANRLVREYDVMCFEDLNLRGISKMFGKKVGEYGFGMFLQKLQYLAQKHGKEVRFVDRFFPSSQTCHECWFVNKSLKDLKIREWTCPKCGTHHDRDRNAAINILREGTSSLGRGSVRPRSERSVA